MLVNFVADVYRASWWWLPFHCWSPDSVPRWRTQYLRKRELWHICFTRPADSYHYIPDLIKVWHSLYVCIQLMCRSYSDNKNNGGNRPGRIERSLVSFCVCFITDVTAFNAMSMSTQKHSESKLSLLFFIDSCVEGTGPFCFGQSLFFMPNFGVLISVFYCRVFFSHSASFSGSHWWIRMYTSVCHVI